MLVLLCALIDAVTWSSQTPAMKTVLSCATCLHSLGAKSSLDAECQPFLASLEGLTQRLYSGFGTQDCRQIA